MIKYLLLLFLVSCSNKDLLYKARKEIIENHPGMYDKLNPNFVQNEEKCFLDAEKNEYNLKKYINCFNDSHVILVENSNKIKPPIRKWSSQVSNNAVYLKIPSFTTPKCHKFADRDAEEKIEQYVKILSQNKDKDLIFDIRGNGGGANKMYTPLLIAIFGKDYYSYKISEYGNKVSIEFRTSKDNVEDIKKYPIMSVASESQYDQAKAALLKGEKMATFYPYSKLYKPAKNTFNHKIYVMIDKNNHSAALSFLDELMVLDKKNVILIGEETGKDTEYTEVRVIDLNNEVAVKIPMKVVRNRLRGSNSYIPNINISWKD